MSIASEIARLQADKTAIANAIVAKGGSVSGTLDNYAQAITSLPSGASAKPRNTGSHTDANGKWHRPENWFDIESLPIDTPVVYYLYDCTIHEYPFVALRMNSTAKCTIVAYDAVSKNGDETDRELVQFDSTTRENANTYYKNLIGHEQVVIKITCTSGQMRGVGLMNWFSGDDVIKSAIPNNYQPIVMRYGYVPHFVAPTLNCYYIESDNLKNLGASNTLTTSQSWANAFYNNLSLQRMCFDGWRVDKINVSSFYQFLATCPCLSDTPDEIDMTGWVKPVCTRIDSMFSGCTSLKAKLKVNNWDLSGCTSTKNMFYQCYSLSEITGTETWTHGENITTTNSMFNGCYSLCGKIDLSGLCLGSSLKLTDVASTFYFAYLLEEINISNTNFSKCTKIDCLFYGTSSLKKLTWDNIVKTTSACTSIYGIFYYCGLPEIELTGWDFSGCVTSGSTSSQPISNFFTYSYALKAVFKDNVMPPEIKDINSTYGQIAKYAHQMRYLDVSGIDLSTSTGTMISSGGFNNMESLVDFYPPQNIKTSFFISASTGLSHDSLVRIINNLVSVTTTQKLTLGSHNLAKLTDAEKAIATNKGWTLA